MDLEHVSIEDEILTQLIYNEPYARTVAPYLKREYFESRVNGIIFDEYDIFVKKYSNPPTKEALVLELETRSDVTEDEMKGIINKVGEIAQFAKREKPDFQWLIDTTETYCSDRAVYLAVMDSIGIIQGEDKKRTKNMIPELLADALSVSFDSNIGHDYLDNADARWEFYHKKEKRLRFLIEWLNLITGGGLPKKTLTILLAPTNAGKTLVKCHLAADFLMQGKNVLYITMEMAEERISERIDANLMGVDIADLRSLPKETFDSRLEQIRAKTTGKLMVKEYPTASAHVGHIRHLLRELRIKKRFIPDVIFIDYLNICASSRIRNGENTYVLVKSIAEELRGLAVEQDVAIISSTQTNRDGWGSSDLELSNTSESAGLPATADLMIGIIVTDQLTQMGQMKLKQLKNRFSDVTRNVAEILNIDRAQMRLSECEDPTKTHPGAGQTHEPAGELPKGFPHPTKDAPGKYSADPFAGFEV